MTDDTRRRLALRGTALLAVLVLVYLWRPLFHSIFYDMFNSPGALIFWSVTLLAAAALWFMPPFEIEQVDELDSPAAVKLGVFVAVVVVAAVLSGLYAVPADAVEERTLAEQTMDNAEEIEAFPAVNPQNARITPRAVADVQSRGSVSYRQYRLGTSDIARMPDGRLAWSYPIQPDGFRNTLRENQQGVVLSDMTTIEQREMRAFDDTPFAVGEGMLLHRGSTWNLRKSDFWAQYRDDAVEFVHDGTPYMAYPKTGHEWHLAPIPHTTPTWEGVALVHPDGTIEQLSPEEARESEILDGQRLYPLYNTERRMESLGYREGIVNQLSVVGSHENEVEVAGLPAGAGNSQPFVIDLRGERMSYVTTLEPYGEDTRGLDEVWFVDAETGELRFFGSERETLLGPERAMGLVRGADTRTDWDTADSSGEFSVVEPVPVTVNGEFWWHAKVVPVDNTDVTRNVFVNADSRETVELRSTSAVTELIANGSASEPEDESADTEPATDDENVAYYIVVEDSDGEVVERIPVAPGEDPTVNFVPAGENDTASNGTG